MVICAIKNPRKASGIEGFPAVFGLRKAFRNQVERGWAAAHADVAVATQIDAFAFGATFFNGALPCHHAIPEDMQTAPVVTSDRDTVALASVDRRTD